MTLTDDDLDGRSILGPVGHDARRVFPQDVAVQNKPLVFLVGGDGAVGGVRGLDEGLGQVWSRRPPFLRGLLQKFFRTHVTQAFRLDLSLDIICDTIRKMFTYSSQCGALFREEI